MKLQKKQTLKESNQPLNEVGAALGQGLKIAAPKLADTLRGLFSPKQSYPAPVVRTVPKPPVSVRPKEKPPVMFPKRDVTDVPYRDIPDVKKTGDIATKSGATVGSAAGAVGSSAIKTGAEKAGTTSGATAAQTVTKSADFAKWLKGAGRLGTAGVIGLTAKELYDLYQQEKSVEKAADLKQLDIRDILKTDPSFRVDDIVKKSPALPAPTAVGEPVSDPSTQSSAKRLPPPVTTATDVEEPVTQTEPKSQRIIPPTIPPVMVGTLPPEPPNEPPKRTLPPIMPPMPPPPPPPSADDEKKSEPEAEPPKPTKKEPVAMPPPETLKLEPAKVEPIRSGPQKTSTSMPDDEDISWRALGGTKEKIPGFEQPEEPYGYLTTTDGKPVVPGFMKDGSLRGTKMDTGLESLEKAEPALIEWTKLAGLNHTQNKLIKENKMQQYDTNAGSIAKLMDLFKIYENEDKSMQTNEDEMEEGNEFSGARADAIKAGKKEFEVDGQTYPVKEDQVNECGDMNYGSSEMPEQHSKINVNASMSSDGQKTLNVSAEGDAAEQLSQLLKLSGMLNGDRKMEVDEEYANEPKMKQLSLRHHLHDGDDLHKEKDTYPKVAGGDNPMNPVRESLESRLWEEFQKVKQQ